MGSIGSLIGVSGGAGGTGFQGPQGANVINAADMGDVQRNDLAQRKLLSALKNQHGLANQTDVYNQGQGLANQFAGANGIGAQIAAMGGMQNIANGQGPNPAQAMLNQATGQNVANQAALMAGQRGAGSNIGLMARQAAQQGGALQQQAVGQGATMQANQQIAALQGLGAMGQGLTAQQQAQQVQQSGLATQMAQNRIGQTNAMAQNTLNSINAQNQANTGMQGNINQANAGMAGTRMQGQADMLGGLMNSASSAATMMAAGGGEVPHMADGGQTPQGPMSSFGQFLSGWGLQGVSPNSGVGVPDIGYNPGPGNATLRKGSDLSGMGSPAGNPNPGVDRGFAQLPAEGPVEEGAATPGQMGGMLPAMGPAAPGAHGGLANAGGHVAAKAPGQKAEQAGDSYANDKVPAMLSEGEIVIPRSVLQSGDPIKGAADFVAQVLAKRGK